jgi:hypothetical protein
MNACLEKTPAGQKTAPRNFFPADSKTRQENASQSLGTHQENSVYYYGIVSGCAVDPNNAGISGNAIEVTYTDANGNQVSYMPTTTVKSVTQANQYGLPASAVNSAITPIFVPPGINPENMINQWSQPNLNTVGDFYNTWKPGGPNDYKSANPPSSSIYDAYGNFEYGATGASTGYFNVELQAVGNATSLAIHGTLNNPINVQDIQSGANAVNQGGVITTPPTHYP